MGNASLESRSRISLSCVLFAAACSSGTSESATEAASPLAPAVPEMTGQRAAPPPLPQPSNDSMQPPATMEGAPVGAELAPPAEASSPGSEGMEPPAATPGAPLEAGAPVPSLGCSASAAAESGLFSIDVAGSPREYILELPEDYDPTRPYRLIFTWHPGGGSAQGTANNVYGLRQNAAGSAIFVSPDGIDNGWANTGGRDLAFLDAMLERLRAELCFDQSRIFSTGFSYGGMMSFAIGCARADTFRAIAPMSGALFSGCVDGEAPIAMLGFHGVEDTVVDLAAGIRARDVIIERNGCEPEEPTVQANGCLAFEGCSQGHSVTWCEFDGGHAPAPQSGQRIWDFFSQF